MDDADHAIRFSLGVQWFNRRSADRRGVGGSGPGCQRVLSWPARVPIYVYRFPTDMRKAFDGLAAIVQGSMGMDPMDGSLFVFRNRRGDRMKILYWDHDGYALWCKRLEAGTFRFDLPGPDDCRTDRVTVSPTELAMLVDGVDLTSVRRRKRYRRPAA